MKIQRGFINLSVRLYSLWGVCAVQLDFGLYVCWHLGPLNIVRAQSRGITADIQAPHLDLMMRSDQVQAQFWAAELFLVLLTLQLKLA